MWSLKELQYGCRKLYLQWYLVKYLKDSKNPTRYREQRDVLSHLLRHPLFTFANKSHENKSLRLLNKYVRNEVVYQEKKGEVLHEFRRV